MGTMHAYEIDYMFGRPLDQPQAYTRAEVDLSRFVIELWTNFAREG
jgi:carboxylesterase type B